MSNPHIRFDKRAACSASTWFTFDPIRKLDWTLEETVARIIPAASDQDLFEAEDMKSVFNAYGYITADEKTWPFIICDWREDHHIHVMTPVTPSIQKSQFLIALQVILEKQKPAQFWTRYYNSEDIFSWPPTLTKEDALDVALDSLNEIIERGTAMPRHRVKLLALEARKALVGTFRYENQTA